MSSTSSELKNEILRAGAGAGKTTTLTQKFLNFAADFKKRNGKFPRIVVTTFTRKATQELKERLLTQALADQKEELFHYVSSKSQVQISTIHGVLSIFLARYGSSIGLTPDYRILSEGEIRKEARRIVRQHLLHEPQLQELLEEYDFATLEEALLKYFGENVLRPKMEFISAQSFARETAQLVNALLRRLQRVCVEILREVSNKKWEDYVQSLSRLCEAQTVSDLEPFIARVEDFFDMTTKPSYLKASPPFSASLKEELDEALSDLKKLVDEPHYRPFFWHRHQKNCELFEVLARLFCRDFMDSKLRRGLLSMGDLETLASYMILQAPETAARFSQEWDYWMVDEYQDTSPAQVALLDALIGSKPVFIVGDPQQSIYLFRGARSEVFDEKVSIIQSQGGVFEEKRVNYRSSPEVLEFLNYYFTRLSKAFKAMQVDEGKVRGGIEDPVVQIVLTEGVEEDKVSAEVLATVSRIQELLQQGVSPEQICVLSRTHRLLEEIAKSAQEYGVPLQLHSGSGFFERREVLDALSILKFLLNPHDNANFVALLRTPWLSIDDSEIAKYCHSYHHSFWQEAQKELEGKSETHPLKILKSLLGASEDKGFSWTFKQALVELGLIDYSAGIDSSGRREANLWKMVSLLSSQERQPGFNFLDFLDASFETLSVEGGEDSDATPVIEPKRVNFMTVHASKGLQFEHVLVPGMGQDPRGGRAPVLTVRETDGLWSLKVRIEETQVLAGSLLAEQVMEELSHRESEEFFRVLYVALTRAKKGITLLWDKKIGKKSWAARCPLRLEEGLQQEGDFSYLVRVGNIIPQTMQEVRPQEKKLRSIWQGLGQRENLKYVSVTEVVAASQWKGGGGFSSSENLGSGLVRAQQGTNAHRIFEALKYTKAEDLLAMVEDALKRPLEYLVRDCEIPVLKIIENGHVEWGFAIRHEDKLVQGQIDLWGVIDDTLWVVDYKTGSQRYSEIAFRQLKAYVWALSQMRYLQSVRTIKLAVIYPMEEVVKVETYSPEHVVLDFSF